MALSKVNLARETNFAKSLYGNFPKSALHALKELIQSHQISVAHGDVKYLDGGWYVTHSGLLRLAERRNCAGIHFRPVLESSDPATSRWVFRAAVFKSRDVQRFRRLRRCESLQCFPFGPRCRNAGGGNPGGQPGPAQGLRHRHLLGRGARFAIRVGTVLSRRQETASPADKRELRRPQGSRSALPAHSPASTRCQPGEILRDRFLRREIPARSHSGAGRELRPHLADWAEKDRNALLCQLNSYLGSKEGAA